MDPLQTAEPAASPEIDHALAGTVDLESVPVTEHVARFEAVHAALADALSAIDGE